MRGKKTSKELIYKIMVSMFGTNNTAETSRELGIPQTTVEKIYKTNKEKEEFVKLCAKKTDEFINTATRIINKANNRLEKEIDNDEKEIPINHLSTVIGTLYDKRALAKGDSTSNVKVKLEDIIK